MVHGLFLQLACDPVIASAKLQATLLLHELVLLEMFGTQPFVAASLYCMCLTAGLQTAGVECKSNVTCSLSAFAS